MRIEKNYYSEEAKLWQEAEEELQQEEAFLTEEERAREEQAAQKEAEKIAGEMQEWQRSSFQVIRKERRDRFEELSQEALDLAEMAPMDIIVETEMYSGQIQMKTDALMIEKSSPESMRETLVSLIKESDSFNIFTRADGLIEFSFFCSFVSGTDGGFPE
ncbi:MAG: hypothetical protein LUF35_00415 [Lachnospiraceae bacterium]|nr:hypothetical protein [Lachnospiraceae bacterium]